MSAYCGIDWADDYHDIAVVGSNGEVLATRRITDDAAGLGELLALLAGHGDTADNPIDVAIETPRGLLVSALRETRAVFAINPLAAARYRARKNVSGAKSDRADAIMLADILRTDRHDHRPIPADSAQVRALSVLTRAQQEAVWERTQAHNKLRVALQECFPAVLLFVAGRRGGLLRPEVRSLLTTAPTPTAATTLTVRRLISVLRKAGREQRLEQEAQRIKEVLNAPALRQPPEVEMAMGQQILALVRRLEIACYNADTLAEQVAAAFQAHPSAPIVASFPGLGDLTGARMLAEIGDDRHRFADARRLKAYAGASPVTRASGRSRSVSARRVKNQRLAATGYLWAFAALTSSAGARAHYDRRRAVGDHHAAAQRHVFNRLLGCLHHCLTTGQLYDEHIAFPPSQRLAA